MKRLILAIAVLFLGGCASQSPVRYWSEYGVGPLEGLGTNAAEDVHKARVTSGAFADAGKRYDGAPKLLRAPQPVMSPGDTDQRVSGVVIAQIDFNEQGLVERITIVESSKSSLSAAVIKAVSQWQISPVTRDGKPVKLVVSQSFGFKAEW